MFYTYLHCKPNGDPFYVGKGHGKRSHDLVDRSLHHRNTVAKYGKENIRIFVFPCESEEQALSDEIKQIAQLRREGYALLNRTEGGEGTSGLVHSEETRTKISAAGKGNKHRLGTRQPPEFIVQIRALHTGNKYNLGRKLSSEERAKISERNKGRVLSLESRRKISVALKGIKRTLEQRARMSASAKRRCH